MPSSSKGESCVVWLVCSWCLQPFERVYKSEQSYKASISPRRNPVCYSCRTDIPEKQDLKRSHRIMYMRRRAVLQQLTKYNRKLKDLTAELVALNDAMGVDR